MLGSYFWILGFCLGMICTIPILGLYHLIKLLLGNLGADRFAYLFTRLWAKSIILTTRSSVTVHGSENLVYGKNVCFISNHQSFFDIPLLMGWLNRPVGFVAKHELKKVPVLSGWIKAIHSAFMDRTNARKAIDSINLAADAIRQGHAIVIFPEGTRSITGQIGEFKTGSLKLAFNSNAIIQPITIIGTRLIYETTKKISKTEINLYIHPAIKPEDDIYRDKLLLINQIHHNICSAYSSNSGADE
jgi:1-acyl-sn-glycerol-3-phosphate acyltransferase